MWEARTRAAVSGPDTACWQLSGEAWAKLSLHQAPTLFGRADVSSVEQRATFSGRLHRGAWTDFEVRLDHPTDDNDILLHPLVGRPPAERTAATDTVADAPRDGSEPPAQPQEQGSLSIGMKDGDVDITAAGSTASATLVRLVSGAFSDQPTTSFVQWDDAAGSVRLTVQTPLDERHGSALVTTHALFPAGDPVPTAIDVTLPRRVRIGEGLVRGKLIHGQLHLRGVAVDGEMLPTLESVSGIVAAVGLTISYEQRMIYREARSCAPETPAPSRPQEGPHAPPP